MVYESLITIVENNLADLTSTWVQEVKKNDYLVTYKKLSDAELSARGNTLFSNLLDWLLKGASNDDAAIYFNKVGVSRINEGFPLSEVYHALYLEKKVLWSYVSIENKDSGILKAVDAIEFMAVINNYFDLGNFYIIKGYLNKIYINLSEDGKYSKEELENKFVEGALFKETVTKINKQMYKEGLRIKFLK